MSRRYKWSGKARASEVVVRRVDQATGEVIEVRTEAADNRGARGPRSSKDTRRRTGKDEMR